MSLSFQRFASAAEFVRLLEPLKAFRGELVGPGLLETLESARLLIPRLRIRYPDEISRRIWLEGRDDAARTMNLPTEPDGPRWDAAIQLETALYQWRHPAQYGLYPHPLDDPQPRFAEFIGSPVTTVFVPWDEMCVDVSNSVESKLFDRRNIESYYTTWQVLFAAEIANAGIHFRVNLADEKTWRSVHAALNQKKIPCDSYALNLLPVYAVREFAKHERALDAVVWYGEERKRALDEILKKYAGGRFRMTRVDNDRYIQASLELAQVSAARHNIAVDDLIQAARLLSNYWSDWKAEERPRIADAYKMFLGETVTMIRHLGNLTFNEVRDRVGKVGGWRKPVLDAIWPDWADEEKERVRAILKSSVSKEYRSTVDDAEVDTFVNFLADQGLEAFFWRLNSFNSHVFRGNEYALQGMKSDLQGMAVAVEHVAATLGGTGTQLYEKFRQLWRDPEVLEILYRGDVEQLMRQKRLAENWPALKEKIDALRIDRAGHIAADLVMAYRIRGGVHQILPVDDQWELELLFVGLMRAALLTYVEVRRAELESQKSA